MDIVFDQNKMLHRRRKETSEEVQDEHSTSDDRSIDRKLISSKRKQNINFRFTSTLVIVVVSLGVIYFQSSKARIIEMNNVRKDENNKGNKQNTCSVYLAPSSVPGGGMGMFAVKAVEKGGIVHPTDGPSIPIIDPDDSHDSLSAWVSLFSSYWWVSGISDPALFEADYSAEYVITVGALPNSHPFLNNLVPANPSFIPYDDYMDRTKDVGAGANSYHMGRHSIASTNIEASDELFLQYPDDYMNWISDKYNIPKRIHYNEAGYLSSILFQQYGQKLKKWQNDKRYMMATEMAKKLIPKTNTELKKVLSSITNPLSTDDMAMAIAKQLSVTRRPVSWIQKNGICLDNIVPRLSKNPRAGKGAIANRFLQKGDVVTPVTLLQITNLDALRIPAFKGDKWQLLLNYCLGHSSSSLLLCPDTNAILVNHCSDRRPDMHPCGGNSSKPNARYQWAKWDKKTDSWLNMTIEEMKNQGGRGLSLEVIATRDIEEGEEVFIDYGKEWEAAWDRHVHSYRPPTYENEGEWSPVKKLNDELGPIPIAPNLDPKFITMDNRNVTFTGCYYYEDDVTFWTTFEGEEKSWLEMQKDEVIHKYHRNYGEAFMVDENQSYSDGAFWPCVVLGKDEPNDSYIVRIIQSWLYEDTVWQRMKLPRIITNYPRKSIRHFYLPYKSDLHLPGVFRHSIHLPDDLFPAIWRDRVQL